MNSGFEYLSVLANIIYKVASPSHIYGSVPLGAFSSLKYFVLAKKGLLICPVTAVRYRALLFYPGL